MKNGKENAGIFLALRRKTGLQEYSWAEETAARLEMMEQNEKVTVW